MKLYQLILISLFFCSSLQLLAQPANDDYTTATALTVQPQQCYDTTAGTLVDATVSGVATGCIANKTGIDVWYSAVVPESGELSVEIYRPVNYSIELLLTAFSLESNTLTSIECDNDSGNEFGRVTLTDQPVGATLYFQIAEEVNVQNNGVGGHQIAFSICAWDSSNTPPNDTYTSAITIPVDANACGTPTQGTLANANKKEIGSACTSYGYDTFDVWYKVGVPSSGELSVQTSALAQGSLTNLGLKAYRDDNGTLIEVVDCPDPDVFFPGFSLSGQNPADTIFIQIQNYDASYNGLYWILHGQAAFQICAWDDATLITERPSPSLLSYYSNPMGNRLRVESPYNIQSLAVYDLVGREVLTKSPQKQKLTLDTYSLAPGVYLLNVQTAEGQQTVKLIKN
ncbi:MAG: T9SS type A sorting domain-containing protein [Flavobacteriaceae bacterium]|nr:T9SS type A sorting domain-containing protein [Flavobacteriaceae bacterium]